jgi:hypothetical protein
VPAKGNGSEALSLLPHVIVAVTVPVSPRGKSPMRPASALRHPRKGRLHQTARRCAAAECVCESFGSTPNRAFPITSHQGRQPCRCAPALSLCLAIIEALTAALLFTLGQKPSWLIRPLLAGAKRSFHNIRSVNCPMSGIGRSRYHASYDRPSS